MAGFGERFRDFRDAQREVFAREDAIRGFELEHGLSFFGLGSSIEDNSPEDRERTELHDEYREAARNCNKAFADLFPWGRR